MSVSSTDRTHHEMVYGLECSYPILPCPSRGKSLVQDGGLSSIQVNKIWLRKAFVERSSYESNII